MNRPGISFLAASIALGTLLGTGCVTDEAAAPASAADIGAAPAGVSTVKMTVDGSGVNGNVTLNGVMVGYTPREIHLEVNPDGTLAYNVTISVSYSPAAGRVLGGEGRGAGPQGGTFTYIAGERVPATLMIRGPMQKEESRTLAPFDTKPVEPTARREN